MWLWHKTSMKRAQTEQMWAKSKERKQEKRLMINFLSDCCSKSYPIIVTVKLSVVASNEVGSQNPNRTCWGWDIQSTKGDNADIPFDLRLLETQNSCFIIILRYYCYCQKVTYSETLKFKNYWLHHASLRPCKDQVFQV